MSLQESNRLVMLGTVLDHMGEDIAHVPASGSPGTITGSVYDSEDWRAQNPGALFGFSYRPSDYGDVEVTKRDKVTICGHECSVIDVERDGADLRIVQAQLIQR